MKALTKIKSIGNYHFDGEIIYELSFVYTVLISFLLTSTFADYLPGNLLHRLLFLGLLPILFKIFFIDGREWSWLLTQAVGLALLLVTWRMSHDFTLVPMGIFILGARNIDFRRIIRLYLIVGLVIMAVTMGSALLGVIKNLIYYRSRGDLQLVRQSFGVIYPTDFAAHVLFLLLAYFYLRFRRLRWWDYGIVLLAMIGVLKLNDARLSAGALAIMIPVFWIGQRASRGKPISRVIASFYWGLPIVAAYGVVVLSYFFRPESHWFSKLDSLISGRLTIGHEALKRYGFSWFGQGITEHGWGGTSGYKLAGDPTKAGTYFFIDSSFLRVLILYGIVVALVVLIIMVVISWRSIETQQFALASVMVIVAISAVVEQRLIDLAYDPFLIAFLAPFVTGTRISKEKTNEN